MGNKERQEGYYWVKTGAGWLILEWVPDGQHFLLDGIKYPDRYPSGSIVEINENRILSPDEQIPQKKAWDEIIDHVRGHTSWEGELDYSDCVERGIEEYNLILEIKKNV